MDNIRDFIFSSNVYQPTCGHQNKRVFSQQRSIDGLQLIKPELMKTEALVEDIHHLLRVREVEGSEPIVGWVSVVGLYRGKRQDGVTQRNAKP